MKLKLFIAGVLFFPLIILAHGLETSQQKTVGSYLIEFEYNTIGNISAGDYTLYFFRLLDNKTKDSADFDSAFVRIEKKNGPAVFAGNQKPDEFGGVASFSTVLADAGNYEANVSFIKADKEIANASFDFDVDPTEVQNKPFDQKYIILISVIAGLIGGIIIGKNKWQ